MTSPDEQVTPDRRPASSPGRLQYATPKDQVIIAPPWGVPIVCAALPFVAIAAGLMLARWQIWPIAILVCAAIGLATPLLMPVAVLATLDCIASERRENGHLRSIARLYVGIVLTFLALDVALIFLLLMAPSGIGSRLF